MGKSDWFNAAINNDTAYIAKNLSKYKQKLDTSKTLPHQRGIPALFLAIHHGNSATVDLLLPHELNTIATHQFTVFSNSNTEITLYPGSNCLHVAFAAQNFQLCQKLLPKISSPDCKGDPPAAISPILPNQQQLLQLFDLPEFVSQLLKSPTFLANCALFGRFLLARKLVEICENSSEMQNFIRNQLVKKVDNMSVYDLAMLPVNETRTGTSQTDKIKFLDELKEMEKSLKFAQFQ